MNVISRIRPRPAGEDRPRSPGAPARAPDLRISSSSYPAMKALCLLSLVLLAVPARADLLVGRVVNSSGVGVAGVNLDAFDLVAGSDVGLANDSTDALGNFSTTIPAGLFRVTFKPPAPPASTLLTLELDNIVVSGTRNLGNVTLQNGVVLSGRVLDTASIPVVNLNLDVVDPLTGNERPTPGDRTDAFGNFSLVVPTTPIELELRTDSSGLPLAPRSLPLTVTSATNLGNLVLQPGFLLEGTLKRTNGLAVASADLDLFDATTRARIFTPRDNSNSSGFFSLLVAAGTYDLEVCPRTSDLLVATELTNLAVTGGTNLGDLVLANGFTLSGTLTYSGGAPAANVDVDVRNRSTGQAVVLCEDNSSATGQYTVIVPPGSFDVTFTAPGGCPPPTVVTNVAVSGATVRNATLAAPVTATAASFSGDGVNLDTVTPVPVVLGQSWSAPLQLGNFHGTGGTAVLKLRTGVFNGATLVSPTGGRAVEVLITGPLLAQIPGTHNGTSGGIAPLLVPAQASFLGLPWAAQYTVSGGGFVDLSRAVFGIVGCQ